jgi:uncharacterized protein
VHGPPLPSLSHTRDHAFPRSLWPADACHCHRVAPDDLEPDSLRAVIESFVLREGTDYGVHETSLKAKVAQILIQLRRGEAHITFDPSHRVGQRRGD